MSTFHATLHTAPRVRVAIAKAVVGVGVLVAIGVTALFLALAGTSRVTHRPQAHAAAQYPPLIQYHGTGAPPQVQTDTAPVPSGSSVVPAGGIGRTEHSYGTVP